MNGLLLGALLTLTGGSPTDLDGPDHEAGCYLGDFDGGESRLTVDAAVEAPFYVGAPGALTLTGTAQVPAGVFDRTDVTVTAATVFQVNATCDVLDLHAADPLTAAAQLTLVVGDLFVFHGGDCDDDGACEAEHDGKSFTLIDGACDVTPVAATVDAAQLGWFVPVVSNGVVGWVRGEGVFNVEARCYGPDDGASASLLQWHRR